MSALALHVRILRRAQRLLPAGLAAVAMLPPPAGRWEASPLSRLRWAAASRRGVLGLRLEPQVTATLVARGLDWLREQRGSDADPACYGDWQALAAGQGLYWTRSASGALALLLDARQASAWLLWQEPEQAATWRCC